MAVLRIEGRLCGPPGNANGGVLAGRLAERLAADGPTEVTFLAPCPVDVDLALEERDGALFALAGSEPVARARPGKLDLKPLPAPKPRAVAAVAGRSRAMATHPFPGCFVCGPERADGLRIFPGPMGAAAAACWTPTPEWDDGSGHVPAFTLWAALDCPSSFPLLEDPDEAARLEPIVLGRMTARVYGPLCAGEPATLIAWPLVQGERKGESAVALHGEDRRLVAFARATWVSVAGR